MSGEIRVDIVGHRAEVVLNVPKKFNMISFEWAQELGRIVDKLDADPNVRVILLWAEGKIFTAGLNLAAFSALKGNPEASRAENSKTLLQFIQDFQKPLTKLERTKKPVIVAVNGTFLASDFLCQECIGGGVDIICACDIRVCTADAAFSIKETAIGMVADIGTIPRITKIASKGLVREMTFTGSELNAQRALDGGLVNLVYETKEKMLEGARELCDRISANSPLAVQGAKRVLRFAEEHSVDDTLEYVAMWNAAFLESEDLMEAVRGFMTKQKPVFKNYL